MRFVTIIALILIACSAVAEDGELFMKNVSKTPELDTNHVTLRVLYKNVPAMTAEGVLTSVVYTDQEGETVLERDYSKPLVVFYHDGPVVNPEDSGEFPGHGQRDVFGAVSLDDGNTFLRSNLSNSGDKSSFRLRDQTDYFGDTFRLFANSAGNKVMVAWASRYANGGNPNYAMTDEDKADLAGYLGIEEEDLYLNDMWGVSGSQNSSDFADEGYPTVGEVPYAALWTCRGTLVDLDEDGNYEVVWRQAERLTSARRDVHRIEVGVAGGAGFVVTWQEDPDGLRPGEGEGPGEGWSGAVAHHQTDVWYSYIDWNEFDKVYSGDYSAPFDLVDYAEEGTPAVGVPMSMPVRLTDNAMCVPVEDDPYVYEDFDGNGISDLCAYSVPVTEYDAAGNAIKTTEMCVAEDGRLMRGNTASTRCRVNLRGYDTDGDDVYDEAWVVLAYEESKGMGEEIDYDPNDLIEKVDMGKNIMYHTFDMRNPELVSQGLMLNMPAVYPGDEPTAYASGTERLVEYPVTVDGVYNYRFMQIDPDPIYSDQAGMESVLLQSEICRRFSLISQPPKDVGESGTVALGMWKQGIIRQGGPADVYGRRFVTPEGFDITVDNPFDYSCMECGEWLFEDGANPRYVKGLCISPPEALSATSLVDNADAVGPDGSNSIGATAVDLASVFPFNEAFDDIEMAMLEEANETQLPKVYEWSQIGPDFGFDPDLTVDGTTGLTPGTNFDDQSWENPYDVAKGHRGFISGDYIMMLYCWSPNWLANTRGHDNYNLYVRRSFDGGQTWTTLPVDYTDVQEIPGTTNLTADGTTYYEWMGPAGGDSEYKFIYDLGEGEFEPTRSMSLLNGLKETVLDPRYAPTGGATHSSVVDDYADPDDTRDPSKFFITFEVGDNTTVEFGEALPMNMYYSRATNYGDDFEMVWEDETAIGVIDELSTDNDAYFDWLEGKKDVHAAEASMCASPGGMFFWTAWEEWKEDIHENVWDTDATLRRLMFLDEESDDGSGGDGKQPGGGGGNKGKTAPVLE
ncbi:MAG: hypothetical protein KOO60_02390 [Gemmatimonadales bacterium]|nr:hypothetical protein [Gemmatimonadales bacterium]